MAISNELATALDAAFAAADDKVEFVQALRLYLHQVSPLREQPVDMVRWVDVDMVQPNDYNPNSVAKIEMGLLYTSVLHDGYTQPVVTVWDDNIQKYVIVDGFHRYFTCKNHADIRDRNLGRLPIVVLNKDINDRMASTIRHNRARGKHSVGGMSNIVFNMLDNGWTDAGICNELGMEPEELLKLKHLTGFSKLFKDVEYKRAWESRNQIKIRMEFEKAETKS